MENRNFMEYTENDYAETFDYGDYFDFENGYIIEMDKDNSLAQLDFGTRLKIIRIVKGIEQHEMANKVKEYRCYENNCKEPDFETLVDISVALDVDMEFLARGYRSPDPEPSVEEIRRMNLMEDDYEWEE